MKKLLTILMAAAAGLFLVPTEAEAGNKHKKKSHNSHSAHKHHKHHGHRHSPNVHHRGNVRVYRSPYVNRSYYRPAPRVYTYRSYGYRPYYVPRIVPGFSFHFGSRGYCR